MQYFQQWCMNNIIACFSPHVEEKFHWYDYICIIVLLPFLLNHFSIYRQLFIWSIPSDLIKRVQMCETGNRCAHWRFSCRPFFCFLKMAADCYLLPNANYWNLKLHLVLSPGENISAAFVLLGTISPTLQIEKKCCNSCIVQ